MQKSFKESFGIDIQINLCGNFFFLLKIPFSDFHRQLLDQRRIQANLQSIRWQQRLQRLEELQLTVILLPL